MNEWFADLKDVAGSAFFFQEATGKHARDGVVAIFGALPIGELRRSLDEQADPIPKRETHACARANRA